MLFLAGRIFSPGEGKMLPYRASSEASLKACFRSREMWPTKGEKIPTRNRRYRIRKPQYFNPRLFPEEDRIALLIHLKELLL